MCVRVSPEASAPHTCSVAHLETAYPLPPGPLYLGSHLEVGRQLGMHRGQLHFGLLDGAMQAGEDAAPRVEVLALWKQQAAALAVARWANAAPVPQ